MKRAIIVPALVTAFVALSPVGVALANNPHTTPGSTGQPNQSAEDQLAAGGTQPAGFNTGGFANATTHYANPDSKGGTNSGNSHVVSQYDVAAFQLSNNHGHTK